MVLGAFLYTSTVKALTPCVPSVPLAASLFLGILNSHKVHYTERGGNERMCPVVVVVKKSCDVIMPSVSSTVLLYVRNQWRMVKSPAKREPYSWATTNSVINHNKVQFCSINAAGVRQTWGAERHHLPDRSEADWRADFEPNQSAETGVAASWCLRFVIIDRCREMCGVLAELGAVYAD